MRLQEILGTPIHHIILLCAPDGRSVNPRASAYRLQNALDKEGGVLFVFDRRKCSANATEELVSFDWDMNNGHWESVNALSIEFGSLKLCSPLFRTVQEYECQCRLHHAMVEVSIV